MSGFKLIAIRTGEKPTRNYEVFSTGAKLDYFKNLETNSIYKFYNDYTFTFNNFNEVIYDRKSNLDLFNINSNGKNLSININAVVGNNGSGKSSLIELLYWANYNIGCVLKLLKDDNRNRILLPYKFLDLEILYSVNDKTLINLVFKNGLIYKDEMSLSKGRYIASDNILPIEDIYDLKNFFYSIAINYSHYALNSNDIGDWIIPLFHKNDGYQTPIVLNPMRTNGIIDINRENGLLLRRLQGNLLEDIGSQDVKNTLRNIANDKVVSQLKLKFNQNSSSNKNLLESKGALLTNQVIKSIENHFNFKIPIKDINDNLFVNVSINYIIDKLLKISTYYRPFHKYKNKDTLKYVDAFIKKIKDDNTHIIFKVKGAILYLKYYKDIFGKNYVLNDKEILIDIDFLSKKIMAIKEKERKNQLFFNTFSMVPPGFFKSEILLEDETSFNSLSSGEKQKIHSISSIIYHIINLNSVSDDFTGDNDKYLNFPFVNIILDEIELYYHPAWQQKYVKDLLDSISRIPNDGLKNIKGINITFLTHSPFILSDIPSINVLKLKEGVPQPFRENEQTFGANINDILANEFFLTNGFMGEFVKTKINSLIDYISDDINIDKEWTIENAKKFIELIGEPLIRMELREMFFNKFYTDNQVDIVEIDKEILRLNKIRNNKINRG